MINISKYLSFFVAGLLIWSCSDNADVVLKNDADFFPVSVGSFFIYDVEETKYSTISGQEDFIYKLKLTVTDSFVNNSGGSTYVVLRSRQDQGTTGFDYLDTWSVRVEASQVVTIEDNISFVRLAFPLVVGKQWNGNVLNTLGGEETCGDNPTISCDLYQVESMGIPFDLNGEMLTETLEIVQNNNLDVIVKQDVRKEIYARNIGLVYKESTILEFCTVGNCIGQQQIENGVKLKQTLVEYGKE